MCLFKLQLYSVYYLQLQQEMTLYSKSSSENSSQKLLHAPVHVILPEDQMEAVVRGFLSFIVTIC